MYHGAEHKTISCYESGLELTVENLIDEPVDAKKVLELTDADKLKNGIDIKFSQLTLDSPEYKTGYL